MQDLSKEISINPIALIGTRGTEVMLQRIEKYISEWRKEENPDYIIKASFPRFGTGEAKGVIKESVRGTDLYLLVDVCNHNLTYKMFGHENHMSPDDHYQDLKRIIAAVGGKARRITVIMPFLYESRQHKRSSRESLELLQTSSDVFLVSRKRNKHKNVNNSVQKPK